MERLSNQVEIHQGDCFEIMSAMRSESIDIIVTDPPYHKEHIYLFGEMANEAKRILKDGSLLMTLCGHHSIDVILSDMRKHLDFYWIGGMPNSSGSTGRYHPRQMMCGWKPCLWFSKGTVPPHKYMFDFFAPKIADKQYHEWGQPVSWFQYYINTLTKERDTILDPFMGGAAVAVAATNVGRKFIGIEIDKETYNIAKTRIGYALAQMKLPFDIPVSGEQLAWR